MRKRRASVKACAAETLAVVQTPENGLACDVRVRVNQELAQDFETMFFATGSCVTQHTIGLD
jgi:hypothetical protein